jgi:hypothetical protein
VTGIGALTAIKWITAQSALAAQGNRGGEMAVEAVKLPWDSHDDIIPNLTIGSVGHSLLKWLTGERGVHAETLMVSVGALAGFAAQNAAFRSIGPPGTPVPNGEIMMAEAGGERYFFGDRINGYLVRQTGEYAYPLWGYIAAAALEAGMPEKDMPDVREMFANAAKTIGTPAFGIPRAPKEHPSHLTPRQALEAFWPRTRELLSNADGVLVKGLSGLESAPEGRTSVPEAHWPLVIALAARGFILKAKGTLDPRLALSLVMESAVTMSKVDPKTVPQTRPL